MKRRSGPDHRSDSGHWLQRLHCPWCCTEDCVRESRLRIRRGRAAVFPSRPRAAAAAAAAAMSATDAGLPLLQRASLKRVNQRSSIAYINSVLGKNRMRRTIQRLPMIVFCRLESTVSWRVVHEEGSILAIVLFAQRLAITTDTPNEIAIHYQIKSLTSSRI